MNMPLNKAIINKNKDIVVQFKSFMRKKATMMG